MSIFPYIFFWCVKGCRKTIRQGKCCVGSSGNTVKILSPDDEIFTVLPELTIGSST